jgi:hypothetical protein
LTEKFLHKRRKFRIVVNQQHRKFRHITNVMIRNFQPVSDVIAWMTLWGKTPCLFVCLLLLTAAEPPLDPVPVCQAALNWKNYDGQAVAVLGRYSFREAGPQKGRWLDQQGCGDQANRPMIRLTVDPQAAPKVADQIAIDEPALEARLAAVKEHTTLGKFRFGSADYDRWAVVFGKFRHTGDNELQLVYRGDGAVFFLAEK